MTKKKRKKDEGFPLFSLGGIIAASYAASLARDVFGEMDDEEVEECTENTEWKTKFRRENR